MTIAESIEAFLAEQRTIGLAEETVRQQGGFIKRFGRVAERAGRDRGKRSPMTTKDIDPALITAYFATCRGAEGNRNQMLVALRKYLRWLEISRQMTPGETDRLLLTRKHLKETVQPKYYVPVEDFPTLLEASVRHRTDRMVMAMALFTLSRRSEIAAVTLKRVDLHERTIELFRQKTRRWTPMGINPELMDELSSYLPWYATELGYDSAAQLMSVQPDWKLIPRVLPKFERDVTTGQLTGRVSQYEVDPMSSPRHMERVVKRGLDATGAVTPNGTRVRHKGEGMHTIRRSGARALLDHLSEGLGQDRALLQVSTMLDHEDVHTTLRYIGMNQERDKLNTWLRGNSMYGTSRQQPARLKAVG